MTFSPVKHSAGPQAAGEGGRRVYNRIQLLASHIATTALDLVFPPMCVHCERVGGFLCSRCLERVVPARKRTVPELDGVCVRADFEGVMSDAIHAFKYKNVPRLAEPLADLLGEVLGEQVWSVDLVAAVPLHGTRLRERGYNQAAVLAACVAQRFGWLFDPEAVSRLRATPSQVNLNALERRANVAGAFHACAKIVQGRRILLIDDVLTTGATMAACSTALREAGALQVFGAAVAGAIHSNLDQKVPLSP